MIHEHPDDESRSPLLRTYGLPLEALQIMTALGQRDPGGFAAQPDLEELMDDSDADGLDALLNELGSNAAAQYVSGCETEWRACARRRLDAGMQAMEMTPELPASTHLLTLALDCLARPDGEPVDARLRAALQGLCGPGSPDLEWDLLGALVALLTDAPDLGLRGHAIRIRARASTHTDRFRRETAALTGRALEDVAAGRASMLTTVLETHGFQCWEHVRSRWYAHDGNPEEHEQALRRARMRAEPFARKLAEPLDLSMTDLISPAGICIAGAARRWGAHIPRSDFFDWDWAAGF